MPITIDEPEVKRMYIGTRFADNVERGAQNLMIGAANKVRDLSKDQEGIHDDALRLIGGGIKNVRNLAKDQEGIHDDMLRLAGGGIKNTLWLAGLAGEAGGWAGGKIAGAAGFDPRIGGAIGGVAGDLLIGGAAAKLGKIGAIKGAHKLAKTNLPGSKLAGKGLTRHYMGKASDARKAQLAITKRQVGGQSRAIRRGELNLQAMLDDTNVFPETNPFPEDKTLSRLYREIGEGWKPRPGEKIYKGDNFFGDAQRLREQGFSATEVSKKLGVKVRKVDGINDVQRLRGAKKKGNPLAMKSESQLEKTSTKIRRRINEVEQTPLGQPGFSADSKAVKALEKTYGGKVNKHHGTGLKQIDFLYDGASPKDAKKLTKYIFEELNEPIGSIAANRMTIHDEKVHRILHNWFREEVIGLEKTGDLTNIQPNLKRYFGVKSLKRLPLKTRKQAAQVYFEHIAPASKEKLFELQQEFIRGNL